MPGIKMTYVICYDDHRSFTDEMIMRFSDKDRYTVESFHNKADFLDNISKEKESRSCRVAIIGIPDTLGEYDTIDEMTSEIKKSDPDTGIILLGHQDKMDEIRKAVIFNIDAYVPRNSNAVLRIHNTVKRLISERNIAIFRKRRNIAFYVLAAFVFLVLIFLLIARIRLPYFF